MEEEVKQTPTHDPLDTPEVNQASYKFNQLLPRIRGIARNLNGKGLCRVLTAINEFPFNHKDPKFRSDTEKELFMLILHCQGLKNVMGKALENYREELEKKAVDGIVEEMLPATTTTEKGE